MRLYHTTIGLMVCLMLGLCFGIAQAAEKQPVPLRTAWLGEHETFLVWYAKDKGWDKEVGLDLTLLPFDSGKTVINEMVNSDWAIAGVGAMPALTASLSHKLYIVGIGNDESATNALYVRADSPILKVKGANDAYPNIYGNADSVRGKTFLCAKGTSAHYMLSRWLHALGLSDKDVAIRDLNPKDALKAFAAGGADGIALWAPQTYEAEKMGLKPVARSSDCNARQPILIVANLDYANKNPEHITNFLKVYMRGVDMIQSTPPEKLVDEYIRFYASWTGHTLTREEALREIEDHPVYPLNQQLAMFDNSKGESELETWLHGIADFHIKTENLSRQEASRLERLNYVTKLYLKKIQM